MLRTSNCLFILFSPVVNLILAAVATAAAVLFIMANENGAENCIHSSTTINHKREMKKKRER